MPRRFKYASTCARVASSIGRITGTPPCSDRYGMPASPCGPVPLASRSSTVSARSSAVCAVTIASAPARRAARARNA